MKPVQPLRKPLSNNSITDSAVTLDIIYFRPPADADKPVSLANIFAATKRALKDFEELSHHLAKETPPEELLAKRAEVFMHMMTDERRTVPGIQRFVLSTDDIADIPEEAIPANAAKFNAVSFPEREPGKPGGLYEMIDAAINESFGLKNKGNMSLRLNFVAALHHGLDAENMIRHVPFIGARQMLLDWHYNNLGPMLKATIAHAPKPDFNPRPVRH